MQRSRGAAVKQVGEELDVRYTRPDLKQGCLQGEYRFWPEVRSQMLLNVLTWAIQVQLNFILVHKEANGSRTVEVH